MVAMCCYTVNVSLSCPSCQSLTMGCETVDMTLRRNGLGQLGFHVRLDGTVAEVPSRGPSKISVTNAAVPNPYFFPSLSGGRVRLRLAGGSQTGESISGDLQGGGCDTDPRADDRPAEDVGHRQSGHHSTI